jgi:hypothetical protein
MKTKFAIWYMKPEWFPFGIMGDKPDAETLSASHVHLKDLELEGGEAQLERVFHDMQGEVWSPEGEARELIERKGLAHTSMSVGDVIIVGGKTWMVDTIGFSEVE